jgi:diaminobutyrate-2-oxoglutarate transaminase
MVAGRVTMNIIRRDHLDKQAAQMGQYLMEGLRQIAQRYPVLGDVRGRGLMIGVEVIKPSVNARPGPQDGELASKIKIAAFEKGLLLETGGRYGAVLRFLPPLIITQSDIELILDRLETAVALALRNRSGGKVVEI